MTKLTPTEAANAIDVLAEATLQCPEEINAAPSTPAHSDSDQDSCSQTPVVDNFYQQEGFTTLLRVTYLMHRNFTMPGIFLSNFICENWNTRPYKKILRFLERRITDNAD